MAYTRIGLGDLNDNLFLFIHCRLPGAPTSCFHIINRSNPQVTEDQCYGGGIPLEEIENEKYMINQPLLYDRSRKNHILFSKTDYLIPDFVAHLLKYLH